MHPFLPSDEPGAGTRLQPHQQVLWPGSRIAELLRQLMVVVQVRLRQNHRLLSPEAVILVRFPPRLSLLSFSICQAQV